ncbi:MAG: CBS domain-containing protein [Desulfovibrio sp.]|nr:CBS domain-containing protein [Desulfovibrio sp.]MBI4957903.1 CBS domain-containing protein [Desulfovibrio sp.]
MHTTPVTDIMTPAEDLPSITARTSLMEAAETLRRKTADPQARLVAVRGQDGAVAGILGMVDLLRGLNPKYADAGFFSDMAEHGVGSDMLGMFVEQYTLNPESLGALTRAASTNTVESLLGAPSEDESIDAMATLDVAIDLMVLKRRDYLLVTRGEETIGVIDAASVFDLLLKQIPDVNS